MDHVCLEIQDVGNMENVQKDFQRNIKNKLYSMLMDIPHIEEEIKVLHSRKEAKNMEMNG
jgi:hypothetical protein